MHAMKKGNPSQNGRFPAETRSLIVLVLVTAACLAPFLGKPFHMDDPLFLLTAKQIQAKPFDFYGFRANWFGADTPMSQANLNPPLAAYYLAAAASILGWSEGALHLAFLLPALAAVLGTYYVARELCSKPMLAALLAALSPAFLLCSTGVMCDTMMVAFWVWAVFFWVRGLKHGTANHLGVAAALISLSALSKYFGLSLVPLLAAYSIASHRRLGRWTWFLGLPLAVLAAYQWLTFRLYGHGQFSIATAFVLDWGAKHSSDTLSRLLVGLAFTGGCMVAALVCTPWLWSGRWILVGLPLSVLLVLPATASGHIGAFNLASGDSLRWDVILQEVVFVLGGLSLLAAAAFEVWHKRDPVSVLLALWCFGTYLYTCVINYMISGRSMLPMVPAAAILLARRLDARAGWLVMRTPWAAALPLIPTALIALLVTWADFCLADASRTAARAIRQEFEPRGRPLWFQGHWGFQYYMEQEGAKPIDFGQAKLSRGDLVASPVFGSNLGDLSKMMARQVKAETWPSCRLVTPFSPEAGAGFHSSFSGPLPYAFIWRQTEDYTVSEITNSIRIVDGFATPDPSQ